MIQAEKQCRDREEHICMLSRWPWLCELKVHKGD
uniref:Uncharacterized protein n=1 Tax=Anguilla anguilla TaxID=7936 RepID=A0A0E9UIS2_ANGAN